MTATTAELCDHRWFRVDQPGRHTVAMEGDCDHPAVAYRCAEPAVHADQPPVHRCRCGATTTTREDT